MQDLYPQLLGCMYYCDPPASLLWIWRHVVHPLLPERVKGKTRVLDTLTRPSDLAILERHVKRDRLPRIFGGTSPLPWPPDPTQLQTANLGITPFRRYD